MSVRSFTHTVLLIDKQKKYKGTQCNKSGIGLVKVVVEAFVTNRSRVCWCDPSLKNPISSSIFAVDIVCEGVLSRSLICKDGGGGRRKYKKIFFVGGKEKKKVRGSFILALRLKILCQN
jgi:hypothetical protein